MSEENFACLSFTNCNKWRRCIHSISSFYFSCLLKCDWEIHTKQIWKTQQPLVL